MPEIFLHHVRHRHAQSGGKIQYGQFSLLLGILQQSDQAIGECLSIAGAIELDGQFLIGCHLLEILEIGTHDRDAVAAGEVGHTTASGRGCIGHHGGGRSLE